MHSHLQDFLKVFGITLDTVKVLIFPRDERMRALISLRAFGLQEIDAVRYYIAMLMAEHGLVSAPNMAIGEAYAGSRRSRFRGETHSEAISYCIKVSGTADGGNEVAAEPKPATKRRLRSGVASPQPEQPPLAT